MIAAVLTAAGLSSRMGRPKPLLRWRGTTLVEHQVSILLEGGASDVIVVLGHMAEDVIPYVERSDARYVVNRRYNEGRTSSIKAGLEAVSHQADDIILMGVDQPRTAQIIRRVVDSHLCAKALLTSPRLAGRGGHPLMFSRRLLPELKLISEHNQGLREVFERHRGRDHRGPLQRSDGPPRPEYSRGLRDRLTRPTDVCDLMTSALSTGDPKRPRRQRQQRKGRGNACLHEVGDALPWCAEAGQAQIAPSDSSGSHPISGQSEWRETVLELWRDAEYREERYAALDLAGAKQYVQISVPTTPYRCSRRWWSPAHGGTMSTR